MYMNCSTFQNICSSVPVFWSRHHYKTAHPSSALHRVILQTQIQLSNIAWCKICLACAGILIITPIFPPLCLPCSEAHNLGFYLWNHLWIPKTQCDKPQLITWGKTHTQVLMNLRHFFPNIFLISKTGFANLACVPSVLTCNVIGCKWQLPRLAVHMYAHRRTLYFQM